MPSPYAENWAVFPVDWVNMPLLSQHITRGPLVAAVYILRKELRVGVAYGYHNSARLSPAKFILIRVKHGANLFDA